MQPVQPAQAGPTVFLDYARQGKPGTWRYALAAAGAVVLMVLIGLALLTLLTVTRVVSPDALRRMQNPGDPGPFYLGAVAMPFALLLTGLAISARLAQGRRLRDFLGRWRWRMTARGFAIWLALLVVGELVDVVASPGGFSWIGREATASFFLLAPPALALQTFTEEVVFRGLVTQGLLLWIRRPLPTAILSGLIFGAFHIPNGPFQALTAAVFGTALALLAMETGGLALGWGIHLANNLFAAMVVVSAGDVFRGGQGLIRQDTPQLPLLDFAFTLVALALITWFAIDRSTWPRFGTFRSKFRQ